MQPSTDICSSIGVHATLSASSCGSSLARTSLEETWTESKTFRLLLWVLVVADWTSKIHLLKPELPQEALLFTGLDLGARYNEGNW